MNKTNITGFLICPKFNIISLSRDAELTLLQVPEGRTPFEFFQEKFLERTGIEVESAGVYTEKDNNICFQVFDYNGIENLDRDFSHKILDFKDPYSKDVLEGLIEKFERSGKL